MNRLCSLGFIAAGLFFLFQLIISCNTPDYVPKPKGYMHIELPKKSYQKFNDAAYPYSFEYPSYAKIEEVDNSKGKYWLNIDFKNFNAAFYLSYKSMKGPQEFAYYLDTCTNFMSIHYQKSSGIEEQHYEDLENRIYACVYKIKGNAVASQYQFWISDSNRHFLRGALYFNTTPNNDSLAPVIDFLGQDITHLINTFRWK